MANTASAPRQRAAMAMTDRRCIVSQPVSAEGLLVKWISIGAPLRLEARDRERAGAVAEARSATATARRCGDQMSARGDGHQACPRAGPSHRLDAPVAVARAAVVVGVVV